MHPNAKQNAESVVLIMQSHLAPRKCIDWPGVLPITQRLSSRPSPVEPGRSTSAVMQSFPGAQSSALRVEARNLSDFAWHKMK